MMKELTKEQSIGYIVKAFSSIDELTLEQFIQSIFSTLTEIYNNNHLNKTSVMIFVDDILDKLDLLEEQQIQVKSRLYLYINIFSIEEAEGFYRQYVSEEILNKFYK